MLFSTHQKEGQLSTFFHPELLMISPGGSTALAFEKDEKVRFIQPVQTTRLENGTGQVINTKSGKA